MPSFTLLTEEDTHSLSLNPSHAQETLHVVLLTLA